MFTSWKWLKYFIYLISLNRSYRTFVRLRFNALKLDCWTKVWTDFFFLDHFLILLKKITIHQKTFNHSLNKLHQARHSNFHRLIELERPLIVNPNSTLCTKYWFKVREVKSSFRSIETRIAAWLLAKWPRIFPLINDSIHEPINTYRYK